MTILKLKSGESAKGMLAYCYENKKGQDSEIERCTEFRNSYGFDSYEDVSLAWTMERQGCGKEKGRQYYHGTLSIDPADPRAASLTNKELADMGESFVKDFAPNHAYAVFVHRDEKHPHVHVLWNSVNLETGKKFHLSNADLDRSQVIKEKLDLEFGIQSTLIKKAEIQQDRVPPEVLRIIERTDTAYIWTEDLKQRIINSATDSYNISDFKSRIKAVGVEVTERGAENKFTYSFVDHHGKQRKLRQDKLGENYGRESLNTAIEQRVEHEFSQGEAAKYLSIKHIPVLSASESVGLRPSHSRGERSNIETEIVRGAEYSVSEGDYSSRTESINGDKRVALERLSGILSGDDKASYDRRPSDTEHKPSNHSYEFEQNHSGTFIKSASGNNFSHEGVLPAASEVAEAGRKYGDNSFRLSEGNEHQNSLIKSEYGIVGPISKEPGREYQRRVSEHDKKGSACIDVEKSFFRRDSSLVSGLTGSGSFPSEVSGAQGNSRHLNHPLLLPRRVTDNRSITDQVKEITVNLIEHIKEWRNSVGDKSTDKLNKSGNGFDQHQEQSRNSSLYEGMQKELSGSDYFTREDASKRMSGIKRDSSDRISQCAAATSERIAEFETNSSTRSRSFEVSTDKSLRHVSEKSSEGIAEFERNVRSRNEQTFGEHQKSARDISSKCQAIGKQVDTRKQEELKRAKERSLSVKSRGYEMEM